jgi:hypothetical protein
MANPIKKRRYSEPDSSTRANTLYCPLQPWQIRVLRVHPAWDNEPLAADLLVATSVSLEGIVLEAQQKLVNYDAISYTWGTGLMGRIIVNKVKLPVPQSLVEILAVLRAEPPSTAIASQVTPSLPDIYRDRYIWADSICINQADTQEKSVQVQKMFDIFSKARTVHVWLGPALKTTALALSCAEALRFHDNDPWRVRQPEPADCKKPYLERIASNCNIRDLLARLDDDLFTALRDLVTRPWVLRVWVQQEIYATRNIRIHCGPHTFSRETYKKVAYLLEVQLNLRQPNANLATQLWDKDFRELDPYIEIFYTLLTPVSSVHRGKVEDEKRAGVAGQCCATLQTNDAQRMIRPECVILNTRFLEATDVRDHLYGVLSMTNCPTWTPGQPLPACSSNCVKIDYSRSAVEVFRDFTMYLLRRDKSLEPLRYHWGDIFTFRWDDGLEKFRRLKGLPNWSPDWSKPPSHKLTSKYDRRPPMKDEEAWTPFLLGPSIRPLSQRSVLFREAAGSTQLDQLILTGIILADVLEVERYRPNLVGDDGRLACLLEQRMVDTDLFWVQVDDRTCATPGFVIAMIQGASVPVLLEPLNDGIFRWFGYCHHLARLAEISRPLEAPCIDPEEWRHELQTFRVV